MAVPSDNIFQRAAALLHAGKIDEAEQAFRGLLKGQPKHVGALNLLSIALVQQGKFAEAEQFIKRALKESPQSDATLYNYGLILKVLGRPAEALECFGQALAINSASAETWNNRGAVLNELGRYEEAMADYDKAISIDPNFYAAYCNKGGSLGILKLYDQALNAYDKALTLNPQMTEAWGGRGNILSDLKQYHEALEAFDKAQSLNPNSFESWSGCGGALYGLNRLHEALAAYDKALALNPNLVVAWIGRGNVFEKLRQFDDATAAYDRALTLKPDHAGAWVGRGNIHFKQGRLAESLADYDRSLALEPDYAEALIGRANIHFKQRQFAEALADYDRALELDPHFAEALIGRGNVLSEQGQLDQASTEFDKALAMQQNLAEAWQGRGGVSVKKRQYADAFVAYDRAYAIKPDLQYLEGIRLHTKQFICEWSNLDAETSHLLKSVREKKLASAPFVLLSIPSSPDIQLQCAKQHAADQWPSSSRWHGKTRAHDRIRVAYVSSDLREHAVGWQTAELFERHDKSRFELTAISVGANRESKMRSRIKAALDDFVDAQLMDDRQIADYMRQREIDIAVDLNGFTEGGRQGVFAQRPAPIQVNYLGYAGTLGAEFYDYILADRTVIPHRQFEFYCEKTVWLPDSYMPTESRRPISERAPARAEQGLPENSFVFCCFNAPYKLSPEIFAIWMRLLTAIEGSVLWLSDQGDVAKANLRHAAEKAGVTADRLIFAQRVAGLEDHLARQRLADFFLDTFPYNAHATAVDALWAGLPVLTCLGETYAGRVAGSLLHAVGLPELITNSLAEYEALAIKLARDRDLLTSLKAKLATNRLTHPLFNTQRLTRNIEAAYETMWKRFQSGQLPAHFAVNAAAEA